MGRLASAVGGRRIAPGSPSTHLSSRTKLDSLLMKEQQRGVPPETVLSRREGEPKESVLTPPAEPVRQSHWYPSKTRSRR
jgi:hypothetical protein